MDYTAEERQQQHNALRASLLEHLRQAPESRETPAVVPAMPRCAIGMPGAAWPRQRPPARDLHVWDWAGIEPASAARLGWVQPFRFVKCRRWVKLGPEVAGWGRRKGGEAVVAQSVPLQRAMTASAAVPAGPGPLTLLRPQCL